MLKTCNKCGVPKETSQFNKSKRNKGGLKTICRVCQSKEGKEYNSRPETKQIRSEYHKEYANRPGKKERNIAAQKRYKDKPGEKEKRAALHLINKAKDGWSDLCYFRHLKHKIGLEKNTYLAALVEQGHRCGNRGCGQKFDDHGRHDGGKYNGKRAHVDHNHSYGHFRGLLCNNCNGAEGFLITVQSAEGMAEYMRKDMIVCESRNKK